jgi:hypothetical protein
MARVRSTASVSREVDDTETTETALISEMMRRSSLLITKKLFLKVKVKLSKLSRLRLKT